MNVQIDEGREAFYDEVFHEHTTPKKVVEAPETVILPMEQYKALLKLAYNNKADMHFKEVRLPELPKDSICVGSEFAAYGDWKYYVSPNGEYLSTYYSIGD